MTQESDDARWPKALVVKHDAADRDDMRITIRCDLPILLKRALSTYKHFSSGPIPDNPKAFVAFQTACRASVAHIELLLKLAQIFDCAPAASGDPHLDHALNQLLQEARIAIDEQQQGRMTCGDGTSDDEWGADCPL